MEKLATLTRCSMCKMSASYIFKQSTKKKSYFFLHIKIYLLVDEAIQKPPIGSALSSGWRVCLISAVGRVGEDRAA